MVTDGSLSFAIFLYGTIQWVTGDERETLPLAGVNAGDGIRQYTVPASLTEDMIKVNRTSNIGVPGVWIFQVNGDHVPMIGRYIIANAY